MCSFTKHGERTVDKKGNLCSESCRCCKNKEFSSQNSNKVNQFSVKQSGLSLSAKVSFPADWLPIIHLAKHLLAGKKAISKSETVISLTSLTLITLIFKIFIETCIEVKWHFQMTGSDLYVCISRASKRAQLPMEPWELKLKGWLCNNLVAWNLPHPSCSWPPAAYCNLLSLPQMSGPYLGITNLSQLWLPAHE